MELADVPRHRPLAFDKMESLIKEMQDSETGVPVRSQKLFLTFIPSAFMGYDLVEWLMERFNLDETSNVEAINLANQLCLYGYFFPVNDSKNLVLKDDSSLYRFQSPYYWPWQAPRVAGSGSCAPTLGPDNVEYAIYLVKRTLRNKQRHGLEEYELEALANLKKNLAAKWDFITMQAEEQVRLAKERKKGDKIVSDSQERAYWRVARPPPGMPSALEPCPVPVRARHPRPKKRTIQQLTREIEHLKVSLDRTRVKTSIALEALLAYSETFAPYDPWLTPPQPSNPWVSDDTLFWQINSPLVEVPSEKRVQRWALSIEELVSDPTGLQEFTSFLRKEYSHENIRFWLAVMDLRRSSTKQIQQKMNEIYKEFLEPGAPCEINIDGATAERVAEGLRTGSRYAFDHAAEHVYSLLLKKDCYPRFVRSDHFQRLLAEGRNVYQKKAKAMARERTRNHPEMGSAQPQEAASQASVGFRFFNFGGQVKKKPGSTSGAAGAGVGGGGLSRRRGSDRSLSGSAHELAVCAAQPPRAAPDPPAPPHSHSQSNLCDIPFKDPLDDESTEVLPWESSSRECRAGRRRQDSAADSGSSSSDVSAAVAVAERTRRLPQQSTLDGGLRGAPPPLRRLSAVEPRHLAPLGSPPHSPRPPRPAPAPAPPAAHPAPPHPTPTISVSSAPDEESAGSPAGTGSPDEPRSLAHSDEPSSVFASADATPTDPGRTALQAIECKGAPALDKTVSSVNPSCDNSRTDISKVEMKVQYAFESSSTFVPSDTSRRDSIVSDAKLSSDVDCVKLPGDEATPPPGTITKEASTIKESTSPASCKEMCSEIGDLPESTARRDEETESSLRGDNVSVLSTASISSSLPAVESPVPTCSASAVVPVTLAPPPPPPPPAPEAAAPRPVAPVAPLAVCEDIGVDEDNVDKVPSAPPQMIPTDSKAASVSDATKNIAHKDELSSVSRTDSDKSDSKNVVDRKQRNDICPWEDENSCESDAPFVKTYATLGYL